MMAILSAQRVTVPSDVVVKIIDGETVLLDLKSECYFGLDEVATRMWQVVTSSDSIEAALRDPPGGIRRRSRTTAGGPGRADRTVGRARPGRSRHG